MSDGIALALAFSYLGTLAAVCYLRREKASDLDLRLGSITAALHEHHGRLVALESNPKAATAEEAELLRAEVGDIAGDLKQLSGAINSTAVLTDRVKAMESTVTALAIGAGLRSKPGKDAPA